MPEKKPDSYEVLGIQKGASPEEINRAYRNKAMENHPDKGGDPAKMKEINAAFEDLDKPNISNVADDSRSSPSSKGASPPAGGAGPAPQKDTGPNKSSPSDKSSDTDSAWRRAGRAAGRMGERAWGGLKHNAPIAGRKAWEGTKATGRHLREGAKTGAKAYGRRGNIIKGLAEKGSGQKSKEKSDKGFAGIGPSGKGGSASQVAKEAEQRTLSAMMAVPEAAIMLPIALFLDAAGLIVFILDFMGVGLGLSFILDIMGICSVGFWVLTRGFFRGILKKIASSVTKTIKSMGSSSQPQYISAPTAHTGLQSGVGLGKKATKAGLKVGVSVVWFIATTIIELIPILGDIIPSWTILVIRELIQGEITQ